MSNKAIPALAALLLFGSGAAWYWWPHIAPTPAPPPIGVLPSAETGPAIANPLPVPAATETQTLPALAESDAAFNAAALALPGAAALRDRLRPENLIRHLVATIDNLPRHRLAVELRPLEATSGVLQIVGDDQQATLDEHNAARYAPLIAIVSHLDMHSVADLYKLYYPLFQQAYLNLGYPNGYFNDRLVAVIDHLLSAPQTAAPLTLVRPKVFWEFADPELEARSAGQKLMLRLGNENAAVVRKKLGELRALVAANQ